MRRKLPVLFKAACLFLVAFSILIGFSQYTHHPFLGEELARLLPFASVGDSDKISNTTEPSIDSVPSLKDGNSTLLEIAPPYIKAIMNPEDNSFPRLACAALNTDRYKYLRRMNTNTSGILTPRRYFFALDLHQCVNLLPRLIGSVVESMRFLGPENCALSIVEGRSDDGTSETLKVLRAEIEGIGATYFFNSSDLDPGHRIRIGFELWPNSAIKHLSVNAALEPADMTCAMDWVYVGPNPTFYDVRIARGMTGDSFFNIPEDGNWDSAWNLSWNDPKAQQRLYAHKPFQVFACWNGAIAFTAKPILERKIRFRGPVENECYQGEPKLFCKDMWHRGHGKIAVIPSIHLEYSDDAAQRIKTLKGYVSEWVNEDGDDSDPSMLIKWETNPPPLVKCMPSYSNQTWLPWDESL